MRLFLPPAIHAVAIDDDIVFLDVAADAYFCLAGAAQAIVLGADGAVDALDPRAVAPLVEAGLLSKVGGAARRIGPTAASAGLSPKGGAPSPRRLARALRANLAAARAIEVLSFEALLDLAGRTQPAGALAAAGAVQAEAARFRRLAPWLPKGGVCLMRSLQMLLYLRAYGLRPAWVFGVRTWPFEAHCWLQAGEVVLDDHLDHVRAFSPILTV